MKNIQIIDGAANSIFEIYEVSDEVFHLIFPENIDIAFLDDVEKIIKKNQVWESVYRNKVDKKQVMGIHGTLHLTGSYCKKEYYPTRKEKDVQHISNRL